MQSSFYEVRLLHWDTLGVLGQSRLVRLTILMPVIGYMILFNGSVVEYLNLSSEFLGTAAVKATLPVNQKVDWTTSYRLYCIYFGLSFFGMGALAFRVCCPNLIQAYRSGHSYIENAKQHITPQKAVKLHQRIEQLREKLPDLDYPKRNLDILTITDLGKEFRNHIDNNLVNGMIEQYVRERVRLPVLRHLTGTLYGIGAITLGIPTVMTFYDVGVSFLEKLF